MNNNTKTLLVGGLIGLVLGLIISPVVFGGTGMGGGMMGANQMMGSMDEHFIEQMIPHHEDAITMANLALTKAEHPEIKQLSQNIINSQTEEINKMKEWYKQWFGKNVSVNSFAGGHMMGGGMMGDQTDTSRLQNAKPFDKAFIEEMIPHHQMAVMMAQMLERTTTRPEMKQLAQDIITTQTREINQMREWYRTWYK